MADRLTLIRPIRPNSYTRIEGDSGVLFLLKSRMTQLVNLLLCDGSTPNVSLNQMRQNVHLATSKGVEFETRLAC